MSEKILGRINFAVHSGRRIGKHGFFFNYPSCRLCRLFDGTKCGHKYCRTCFYKMLRLSGQRGSRLRRALGAICRSSRKLYIKLQREQLAEDIGRLL